MNMYKTKKVRKLFHSDFKDISIEKECRLSNKEIKE